VKPIFIAALAISSAIVGAALEQHFGHGWGDDWPNYGLPLAIVHKGDLLSGNPLLPGITGDVRAGRDLAIMLFDGHTIIRPLVVADEPCGYPADQFEAMQDGPFHRCESMMKVGYIAGASISDVAIWGNDNRKSSVIYVEDNR